MLHSGQRNSRFRKMLCEIMQRQLEIVNRLRHRCVFEHAFHSIGEFPVFQRDHCPGSRRIRNSNALHASGTLILRIRGPQG